MFLADGGSPYAGLTDWTALGVATATTSYPSYPASRGNDTNVATSWFGGSNTCSTSGALYCCNGALSFQVNFGADRQVSALELRGNREFANGYDIYRARAELLDASGNVLASYPLENPVGGVGDWTYMLPASITARSVRLAIITAQDDGPGLAELRAWGP